MDKTQEVTHSTREGWLNAAAELLWPMILKHGGTRTDVRYSCAWPSRRPFAGKNGGRRIGECWHMPDRRGRDIFISPALDKPVRVLDTLLHEMIHAALPPVNEKGKPMGHKAPFARLAKACGLEGKPTATHAGEALEARLVELAEQLGAYPHKAVDRSDYRPQGTRMMKVVCPDCGYTLRTTRMWLEVGLPTCCCGAPMTDNPEEDTADELLVAAQHLEYRTKDGRFLIRYSRDGRRARKSSDGRWTLTDMEAEGGARMLAVQDKQDALDTADAIREGLFEWPVVDISEPEDALAELEADEDWGEARASELDDILGDDELEAPDYDADMPVDELPADVAALPEHERFVAHRPTEDEYVTMTTLREQSGARKSEQIALGIEEAMD